MCARPNAIDEVDFALHIAGPIQEFYEKYFNIAYPLPKTGKAGHIAIWLLHSIVSCIME